MYIITASVQYIYMCDVNSINSYICIYILNCIMLA